MRVLSIDALIFQVKRAGFSIRCPVARVCKVAKFREPTLKRQINGANWAVTLFANDHLGAAMQAFHFFLPMRHFFQIVITGFSRSL